MMIHEIPAETLSFEDFKNEILSDYQIAVTSREASLLGRREVLSGKGKFGIFGDGKELPQIAMAKFFKEGDFRSGYYRDQTFIMAIDCLSLKQFFAGLYGHLDIEKEPMSAGRQMGGHYVTHSLNSNGTWKNLTQQRNSAGDISPTAAQIPRLIGLAQASKVYKTLKNIPNASNFSINGNEVAWGTIGNASTSEGLFLEAINAAGVLQIPMIISVWDDDYGISVHNKHHTTKESISDSLKGYQREKGTNGIEIFTVNGWDYPNLITTYEKAERIAREQHIPVLIHVKELTQPQGHSTSGSHERYKSKERLQWEKEFDCNAQMRTWILSNGIATEDDLLAIESLAKKEVQNAKKEAWEEFTAPLKEKQKVLLQIIEKLENQSANKAFIKRHRESLISIKEPVLKDLLSIGRKILRLVVNDAHKNELSAWITQLTQETSPKFSSHLYSESASSHKNIAEILPTYDTESEEVDGRIILRDNFDAILTKYSNTLIFGEDVGTIGDVNQGLEGLQDKHGEIRVADTGIRESTIIGQGIGMALRGLRPIAEIQYVDYVLYAIQTLSDDLASLLYRTAGRQKAPLIIRTRGHRLEGIWHSGSPMGMIINAIRGILVLVPRNMTKAAGFYNTLLETDEPAMVIECLNGYRLKEKMPSNIGEFKTPIGVVETIREGKDITVVSYGSTLRLVEQAAKELLEVDIDIEIIDIQSLIPFDTAHDITKSVMKTNRLLVVDEDVPGGASAYILQKIVEEQNAYEFLDSKPQTLTAKEHRPAYNSDGDYFSKPSVEDIFEKIYFILHESNPTKYPSLY